MPYAEDTSGNVVTEDLVWLMDGFGIATGIDLKCFVEATAWIDAVLGRAPERA